MDQSKVKALVDKHVTPIRDALGLHNWRIVVGYEPEKKNWAASCKRTPAYNQAEINIDPAKADGEADVLRSLRHELLHILLAPFDVYRNQMVQHLKTDSPESHKEKLLWDYLVEQAVINLERAWDGIHEYAEDQSQPRKPKADSPHHKEMTMAKKATPKSTSKGKISVKGQPMKPGLKTESKHTTPLSTGPGGVKPTSKSTKKKPLC